jgi:glutamine synthetase
MIVAEYIWLDAKNNFRHKTKSMQFQFVMDKLDLSIFPEWNYDGSSTKQANTIDSEVILKPVYFCVDPFRTNTIKNTKSYLVLCETYNKYYHPLDNNTRTFASEVFKQKTELCPWYGIEQEYFIMDVKTNKPLGFQDMKENAGEFYCKMGKTYGREIAEEHLKLCIESGLNISGMNAEVAVGQWEYQIGPCEGILAADQLMISRYILEQVADRMNVKISYDPKPIVDDCNGSGCHTNFSTLYMREGNLERSGIEYIYDAVNKLSQRHSEHMLVYGSGNEKRMTGQNETSHYDIFTHGLGSRNTSIRIGNKVLKERCGYFEDRRPSANMDPYLVTAMIFKTCCL